MSRRGNWLNRGGVNRGWVNWGWVNARHEGGGQAAFRKGTVSLPWLFLLGIVGACSEPVSSATTASSLLPDERTSSHAGATGPSSGEYADAAAGSAASELSTAASSWNPTGVAATNGHVAAPDGGAATNPDPTHTDGGVIATGVDVVDGHLPELSPRADADTCGIPVENGPPLCDPVANCGCDVHQTCAFTPDRIRLFTCVSPGNVPAGERCDADDSCAKGSVCVDGLCASTCRLDADCGSDTCATVPTLNGVVEHLRVCVKPCDPLDSAACGQGATCANAPGTATFGCVRQGNLGATNEACAASSDCAPGLGCALDGVCRAWCSLDGATDAAGTESESLETPRAGVCPEYSECLGFHRKEGLGLCGASCPVPAISGSECSLIPTTCGCPQGETCQVEFTGKTVCGPPGPSKEMERCSKNGDCSDGLSCIAGLCRPLCDPELLPCADGSGCLVASTGVNSPSACLGHCDPVSLELDDDEFTPCGVGGYCAPGITNDAMLGESYCARQNDAPVQEDAACTTDYQCQNGFGCDPRTKTCRPWCREPEECDAGEACDLSVLRVATGGDPVGLCR